MRGGLKPLVHPGTRVDLIDVEHTREDRARRRQQLLAQMQPKPSGICSICGFPLSAHRHEAA